MTIDRKRVSQFGLMDVKKENPHAGSGLGGHMTTDKILTGLGGDVADGETSSTSLGSLSETDFDVDSDEGDEEGACDEEQTPRYRSKKNKGTQTEWSWTADIVAYTKIRGLDIKDLEQIPYPESVMVNEREDTATNISSNSVSNNGHESVVCQSRPVESPSPQSDLDKCLKGKLPEPIQTGTRKQSQCIFHVGGTKPEVDVEAGTPTILKYIRESELPPRPSTLPYGCDLTYKNAVCRLCDAIIPLMNRTDLCPLYCTNCTKLIQSHRVVDNDVNRKVNLIDIRLRQQTPDTDDQEEENGLLQRKVSSRNKRRLGKEKALAKVKEKEMIQKLREQELARQRISTANQATDDFYLYDKNMKTISYSLSSERCMEKGWTLRPKTAPVKVPDYGNVGVEMRVDHFTMAHKTVIKREYEDGRPFLLFMPDGTGQCYYPSGVQAVSVTAAQHRQFCYVIKSDFVQLETDESTEEVEPQILSCFTPSGYGCCYHSNGTPHLVMTTAGGSVYASDGSQRKTWTWNGHGHRHAPPFQPIWLSLSKYLSVRVSSQENIMLTFSCQQRTARFTVGWKGPLKQGSNLSSSGIVDSHKSFLKSTHRRIHGLMIAIQDADSHPKSCTRRITPNMDVFRTPSAPGKLHVKSPPAV